MFKFWALRVNGFQFSRLGWVRYSGLIRFRFKVSGLRELGLLAVLGLRPFKFGPEFIRLGSSGLGLKV